MRLIVNVHNIVDGPLDAIDRKSSPRITLDQFREVIDVLSQRFMWTSLDDLIARLDGDDDDDDEQLCVLTFDDGYRGVLTHAAPLLRSRGIPGAMFVITSAIGSGRELLHFEEVEVAYRISPRRGSADLGDIKRLLRMLPDPERRERQAEVLSVLGVTAADCRAAARGDERFAMLDAGEIAQLRDAGWTIGSHTRTHRALSVLSEHELESEIVGSRDDLRALLDIERMPFAYPYGGAKHISAPAAERVAAAGYSCALTMLADGNPPGTNRMALRRVDVRDVIEHLPLLRRV
jgi:peptidoglycan/xylan/chitin deacetylase (PgdA/CDA1 family)